MIWKLLRNPLLVKLALLAVVCFLPFIVAISLIRRMRRNVTAEAEAMHAAPRNDAAMTFAAYEGVIRQLRQEGKELQKTREEEQQQVAASDSITEAVLSNLSCGVVFFDRTGLVRQVNRAAKSILGYASPNSFHVRELFRGITRIEWQDSGQEAHSQTPFVEAMQQTLRAAVPFPRTKIEYLTPGGHKRVLGITAAAVRNKGGEIIGISCLINDLTEFSELLQQAERNENLASLGEISAGLVNDFRKSLSTISAHAESLVREDGTEASRYYAVKILAEAESLARVVSEFLEFAGSTRN